MVDTFASAETYLAHLDVPMLSEHCALLDFHMPGMNGLQLLRILFVRHRSLPVVVLTANPDDAVREQALQLGAVDCLTKPVPEDVLLGAIENIREGRDPARSL